MARSNARDPLLAAREKVLAQDTDRSTIRWASWKLFDAGVFDVAETGFRRLVDSDTPDLDALVALTQLASDIDQQQSLGSFIEDVLAKHNDQLPPPLKQELLKVLFDATFMPNPDLTLRLLQATAESGPASWNAFKDETRANRLIAAIPNDSRAVPILEQWLYAPKTTDFPAQAVSRLDYLGCQLAHDRALAREIERLLHLVGEVAAAYRVEACRRAATRLAALTATTADPIDADQSLPPIVVAIAGGHTALRSLAKRDLKNAGVSDVREVASAWEGVRDGREVDATIGGCDLIVLVTAQIAHSTSDQVKKAASRHDLPLAYAETATASSIRREVERYAARKDQ